MPGVITHCICVALCYTIPMRIKIDEEWEHAGVTYWLQAEAEIDEVEDTGPCEYFGTVAPRTTIELGSIEVMDLHVLAYAANDAGYEIPVEEPRLLQAARDWVKEHGYQYA